MKKHPKNRTRIAGYAAVTLSVLIATVGAFYVVFQINETNSKQQLSAVNMSRQIAQMANESALGLTRLFFNHGYLVTKTGSTSHDVVTLAVNPVTPHAWSFSDNTSSVDAFLNFNYCVPLSLAESDFTNIFQANPTNIASITPPNYGSTSGGCQGRIVTSSVDFVSSQSGWIHVVSRTTVPVNTGAGQTQTFSLAANLQVQPGKVIIVYTNLGVGGLYLYWAQIFGTFFQNYQAGNWAVNLPANPGSSFTNVVPTLALTSNNDFHVVRDNSYDVATYYYKPNGSSTWTGFSPTVTADSFTKAASLRHILARDKNDQLHFVRADFNNFVYSVKNGASWTVAQTFNPDKTGGNMGSQVLMSGGGCGPGGLFTQAVAMAVDSQAVNQVHLGMIFLGFGTGGVCPAGAVCQYTAYTCVRSDNYASCQSGNNPFVAADFVYLQGPVTYDSDFCAANRSGITMAVDSTNNVHVISQNSYYYNVKQGVAAPSPVNFDMNLVPNLTSINDVTISIDRSVSPNLIHIVYVGKNSGNPEMRYVQCTGFCTDAEIPTVLISGQPNCSNTAGVTCPSEPHLFVDDGTGDVHLCYSSQQYDSVTGTTYYIDYMNRLGGAPWSSPITVNPATATGKPGFSCDIALLGQRGRNGG